ncbi:MAG: transposase family protein [Heteroscytonema crispum UTEX LB 1556]
MKISQNKTKNRELTAEQKEKNQELSSERILVEHLIRLLKIFRVAPERFRLKPEKYKQIILTNNYHNFWYVTVANRGISITSLSERRLSNKNH